MPRTRVVYHGRVQGVGFRATTRGIAARHPDVTGGVRNLPDGTVELEAQGTPEAIDRFLAEILRQFAGYVTDAHRSDFDEVADETGFAVRY
jgi:acylphosphatase